MKVAEKDASSSLEAERLLHTEQLQAQKDEVRNYEEKIKTLEIAANDGTLDNERIFEIYKQRSFDLNTLINADIVYQSFDNVDARALVYQKYLLTDKIENKINQLVTLKEMFKKDKLNNVFTEFMSNELKKINV